jgi:ankyrin repeat protein/mono/diheme cytochrome c family protein
MNPLLRLKWMTASREETAAGRPPRSPAVGCLAVAAGLVVLGAGDPARGAERVDFARDIQPILHENCVECHGPNKQKAGLRLDRKSSATKAFSRRIVAGNSANSMVYQRLVGVEYGSQMPPTAELEPEKIARIKAWIEQGAEWPDALSVEDDPVPPDPRAVALVDALQRGDRAGFLAAVEKEPALLDARGPEGSTPFMFAALYGDVPYLARLLDLGADPNRQNDVHASALLWVARDLAKTRLLVERGADVNVRSDDRRTPLMVAARRPGGAPIVKYLLDHGAQPNPNSNPAGESSPLMEALTGGDPKIVELLVARGADAKAVGEWGLTIAVVTECRKGLDLLAAKITDTNTWSMALGMTAVLGDARATRLMLDRGADPNALDPFGRTPLMYAVISDRDPVEVVRLLIERGAEVNATNRHTKAGDAGLTVLDLARLNGDTPVVRLLERHGARAGTAAPRTPPMPRRENTVRGAVEDSLPLLQQVDANLTRNAGCTSCHNNSLQSMALGLARRKGLAVDPAVFASQAKAYADELRTVRERLLQGWNIQPVGDMFSDFVLGYDLLGLQARNHPADLNTDAAVMMIRSRQKPSGEWPYPRADQRPPICLDYVAQTSLAMRALQIYPPRTDEAGYAAAVRRAAGWLAKARSANNDDRAWRVTGLAWAGSEPKALRKAVRELLAQQREDGGWAERSSLPSSAYATGLSLFALHTAGMSAEDPVYQRGVQYLLRTQLEDGSWYARTRALGFQPYFDAGFPHEHDQWISAAGTSWATIALTFALPDAGPMAATR